MPIPALTPHGILPAGLHSCTFTEAQQRFCWNPHRVQLWSNLERFLDWYWPQRLPGQIYLDGSFVTDKPHPGDIDVVADITGCTDAEQLWAFKFLTKHKAAIGHDFSVDFWFSFPDGNDFVQFFQYAGPKTGARRGVDSKHKKGILRIVV